MRFALTITGEDEIAANINIFQQRWSAAAERSLYRRMEMVMSRSKNEFVPVDLGALKNSGYVSFPTRTGNMLECIASYGGTAAAYALAIHEHPSAHSPFSWRRAEQLGRNVVFTTGGPKYLERPLMEWAPNASQDIAADIRAETGL